MSSYLQIILHCFSKMDIEGLRTYLKKDYSYQDTSQESFLDKIDVLFSELNRKGDNGLEVIEGNCVELSCRPNSIRTGYRFIGNVSRDYLDLRFILDGNIQSSESDILDIFTCNCFCTKETGKQLGNRNIIEVFLDEEVGFNPSIDFTIHSSMAKSAILESQSFKGVEVEFAIIEQWLVKYRSSFIYLDEILRVFSKWSFGEFMQYYYDLNSLIEVIIQLDGVELPKVINLDSEMREKENKDWVVKFEEIMAKDGSNFYEKFYLNGVGTYLDYWGEFLIVGGPIQKIGELILNHFIPIKEALMEKYFALTESDLDKISEEYSFMEDPLSLYKNLYQHLEIRERALKNGEQIPFYLNSYRSLQSN